MELAFFLFDLLLLAFQLAAFLCFLPHLLTNGTLFFLGALLLNIILILYFHGLLEIVVQFTDKFLNCRGNALIAICRDDVVLVGNGLNIIQRIIQLAKANIVQHILKLCGQCNDHQAVNRNVSFGRIAVFIFFKGGLDIFLIFFVTLT